MHPRLRAHASLRTRAAAARAQEYAALLNAANGSPMPDTIVALVFANVDADGDGFVSTAEFVAAQLAEEGGTDEGHDAGPDPALFDLNHDGQIDLDELHGVFLAGSHVIDMTELQQEMASADHDKSGTLSYAEFSDEYDE